VPVGELRLLFTAEGRPDHERTFTVTAAEPDLGDVALPSPTLLTGVVVDEDDRPLPGATLRLLERDVYVVGNWWSGPKTDQIRMGMEMLDDGRPAPGLRAAADGKGRFRVEGLSPGDYFVSASAAGHATAVVKRVEVPAEGEAETRLVLGAGSTLEGKVLDVRGRPVERARVVALSWNDASQTPYTVMRDTTAKPDGTFVLDGVAAGSSYLVLAAAANGHIGVATDVDAPAEELEIRVGPRFRLVGSVVDDETGAPVEGADLFAILGRTKSDENGRYQLEGIVKNPFFRGIWIHAEGYRNTTAEVDLTRSIFGGPVITLDVRLKRMDPGSVVLTVTDQDGRPLEGARVTLRDWGSEEDVAAGTTGEDGVVRFPEVPPKSLLASAAKSGYVLAWAHDQPGRQGTGAVRESSWLRVESGQETQEELRLFRTGAARAVVRDAAGKPVEGATANAGGTELGASDGKGAISLDGLPLHLTVPVVFSKEGYVDTAVQITGGAGGAVEVVLPRGATLAGIVVDEEGEPVPGARMATVLRPRGDRSLDQIEIDSRGRFRITGRAAGRYSIHAWRDGFAPTFTEEFVLRDGETIENVRVVLKRGVEVTVSFSLSDGTPAPAMAILYGPLESPEGRRLLRQWGVRESGELTGRFEPGRYRILATPGREVEGAGAVEVERDLTADGEVRVAFGEAPKFIRLDAKTGDSVEFASMRIERTEPAVPEVSFWWFEREGDFLKSPPLPPGRYRLTLWYRPGPSEPWAQKKLEGLEPGGGAVEIDLTK